MRGVSFTITTLAMLFAPARKTLTPAVKVLGLGDRRKAVLEDIAVLTRGRVLFQDLRIELKNLEPKDVGRAKNLVVDKDFCRMAEGAGPSSDSGVK